MAAAGSSKEMADKSVAEAVFDDYEYDFIEEEDEDTEVPVYGYVPGPLISLKEQIEKDKDDESLRRWKEKLLGPIESELNGNLEPEVKFYTIGMVSDDVQVNTTFAIDENNRNQIHFVLKEGSLCQLKITFRVSHNIVSGLAYTNTVWKGRFRVDRNKGMLGTFAPRKELYEHAMEEEITPCGVFARGTYFAKLKFEDDDKKCHMELKYSFEIKKSN